MIKNKSYPDYVFMNPVDFKNLLITEFGYSEEEAQKYIDELPEINDD